MLKSEIEVHFPPYWTSH